MDYRVIRSNRRTLGMQITEDGILVRAPYFATPGQIERFVQEHAAWAEAQLRKQAEKRAAFSAVKVMTPQQFERLKKLARTLVPQRIAHYAPMVGVASRVNKVFIRCQRTKWGSCSANGNININCLLLLAPPQVLDSVVVHELCHLYEFNHSPRFWERVSRYMPDYAVWRDFLRSGWVHPFG